MVTPCGPPPAPVPQVRITCPSSYVEVTCYGDTVRRAICTHRDQPDLWFRGGRWQSNEPEPLAPIDRPKLPSEGRET